MATGSPRIVVRLVTGESQMAFVRFLPGQPVAAITVGLDGNWRVAAPGVARAHFSLLFDGQQLFVAALVPDAPVYIDGAPIDGRWWTLPAPSELRFGHGCLRVAVETASLPAPDPTHPNAGATDAGAPGAAGATVLGAVAQWQLQHRDGPYQGGTKTQLYDPSMLPQRHLTPARGQAPAPAGAQRTGPPPAAHAAPPAPAPAPVPAPHAAPPAPAPPAPAPRAAPAVPDRGPSWVPPSVGEPPMASTQKRPLLPGEQPPDAGPLAGGSSATAPSAVLPERPASPLQVLAPGGPAAATIAVDASAWVDRALHANVPPAKVSPTPAPPAWAANRADPWSNAMPEDGPVIPMTKPAGKLIAAWRSASLVKKVTFILLPLAFTAVLLPEPKPPPGPAASARALSSSAGAASGTATRPAASTGTASVSKIPSAGRPPASALAAPNQAPPDTNPTAAGSASSEPAVAARPASADATERAAIDAAFEGSWPLAIRLYDGLAQTHPDQPAFREAARILRETKTHTK